MTQRALWPRSAGRGTSPRHRAGLWVVLSAVLVPWAPAAPAATTFYAPLSARAVDTADRLAVAGPTARVRRPLGLSRACSLAGEAGVPKRWGWCSLPETEPWAMVQGVTGTAQAATRPATLQANQAGRPSGSALGAGVLARARATGWLSAALNVDLYRDADGLRIDPTGTMLSVGGSALQLDLGFRPHWFGPGADGALMIGSNAPAPPAVTIGNPKPLGGFLRLDYETFLASLSAQERIQTATGTTPGRPWLWGLHVSSEPIPGVTLGVSRLLQFGGGARRGGPVDALRTLVRPSRNDNTPASTADPDQDFGDQLAALHGAVMFPGRVPMKVYGTLGAEDKSYRVYRAGNAALLAGLYLPRLGRHYRVRYEFLETQQSWYTHPFYSAGNSHKGNVLGHWVGDRMRGDRSRAHSLRVGFAGRRGTDAQVTLRRYTKLNAPFGGWQVAGTVWPVGSRLTAGGTLGQETGLGTYGRVRLGVRWSLF